MYQLKPVLKEFDMKLPTCMYTLKNHNISANAATACNGQVSPAAVAAQNGASVVCCNGSSKNSTCYNTKAAAAVATTSATSSLTRTTANTNCACKLDLDILGSQIQRLLKSSCDASVITLRQDKVLQQLQELKLQLAGIRSTLGICQKGPQHTAQSTAQNGGLREEALHDIVINGHPNFIPYALLALKNAWKDLYTIDVKTFTHSTMNDIGPEAKAFERKLAAVPVNATKPKISVTLIWKNCEHTEMISSPTMYVPIYGEVNIIRYLGRIGPAEYRYENSVLCNEIDSVLDICYHLLRYTAAKSIASLLRALSTRLQNQQYFGGDCMSVADIGVHSSLKRMTSIREQDLTPTLKAWLKRVQPVTMI